MALAASAALLIVTIGGGRAEESAAPLAFTVHPSGIEPGPSGETLDEKLARRERSFRFICLGCVRVEGHVDTTTPFRPIETLNAPQLTAALASEDRMRLDRPEREPIRPPALATGLEPARPAAEPPPAANDR